MVLWKKPTPRWPVDPDHVEYGSVLLNGKPAVMVRYRGREVAQYMPLDVFVARTRRQLEAGRSLSIDLLRVSPRTKRRYKAFFERLTDWSSATHRALEAVRAPRVNSIPHLGSD